MPKGEITAADGTLLALIVDNPDTGMEHIGDEPSFHNSYLIHHAVNEYDALCAIAEAAKKLVYTPLNGSGYSEQTEVLCQTVHALDKLRSDLSVIREN